MEQRKPPGTEEGWYALHDLRHVEWDAWREAPEHERERALEEGIDYLQSHVDLADSDAGGSAVFSIVGHKGDILILHLRPTLEALDRAERRFESTAFAGFTERASSYVSVTEVSGYMHEDLVDGIEDIEDTGMRNYMQQRIYPTIPDAECVCFYPMDKRRDPEYNWYDLPFDERAEYMSTHGEIGRKYAGKVSQIITGSVGLDDYEWGVTLFADEMTDVKHLLYEMRFDPSSSKFAEFGPFYIGRQFPPSDLPAFLAGETVPTENSETAATKDSKTATTENSETATPKRGEDRSEDSPDESREESSGRPDTSPSHEGIEPKTLRGRLARFGIDLDDHAEAGYGLLFEADMDAEDLTEDIGGLRGNFDHYDTHVLTSVRADSGETAVISLWKNERAANTASGFLADLAGVSSGVGASLGSDQAQSPTEHDSSSHGTDADDDIRGELEGLDIYAGKPHGEDVYAMVLYSEADPETLQEELSSLAERFDHYDTHVKSAVYGSQFGGDRSAIVSLWETREAADTASGFLSELPRIVARSGADEKEGFGTMGMFYTVLPEHRDDFVQTFEETGELLSEMDGHLETDLLANVTDENDMFIASQWRSQEDAMEFFRSDAFKETVEYGREVLADRPRHVFLA